MEVDTTVGYCIGNHYSCIHGFDCSQKGALWLHGLIEDLKIHHKHICLFCDSKSSIHLEKDYSRTQHVVEKEDILFQKIRIAENLANMMTKPVPLHKFKYYFDLILV